MSLASRIAFLGQFLALFLVWACQAAPCPGAENAALASALATITTDDLRGHVEILADDRYEGREAGARGGHAAAGYIVSELEKLRLPGAAGQGKYFQPFQGKYRNILAVVEGADPELRSQAIVVGAHYDHVGYGNSQTSLGPIGQIHNGADDNASGVSGLLEVAQALQQAPRCKRTILLAFWDAEEKGLYGSIHWLAHPTWRLQNVPAAINLDMIGRLRNRRVEVSGVRTAQGWRRLVAGHNDPYDLTLDFPWEIREDSDHHSFFARKMPVIMLHTGLHDQYHRPSDDTPTLEFDGLRDVARFTACIVYDLANRPALPSFRSKSQRESQTQANALEAPSRATSRRLGATLRPASGAAGSKAAEGAAGSKAVEGESAGPKAIGLEVAGVEKGSAAEHATLQPGDTIVSANGRPVATTADLRAAVLASPKTMQLQVLRNAAPVDLAVQLPGEPVRLGLGWRWDEGEPGEIVVTRVEAGSPAERAGLKRRDRVCAVAGQEFSTSEGFSALVDAAAGPTELLVERDGRLSHRTVELEPRVE